jgi:antitoxin component YwqK of YwqJK toxin-antitoxin module
MKLLPKYDEYLFQNFELFGDYTCKVCYYPDTKKIMYIMRRYKGLVHGYEDGKPPGIIGFHRNGDVSYIHFYKHGKLHRENGQPAKLSFYEYHRLRCKMYYVEGELHREDGPAFLWYYEFSGLEFEKYFIRGMEHRNNEPAKIFYSKNGEIERKEYYRYGRLIIE